MDPENNNYYSLYYAIKKARFWRFFSFFILIASIILTGFILVKKNDTSFSLDYDYIARINIKDVIAQETEFAQVIEDLKNDDNLKGAIIYVDSPGGTTVDSEILYDALYALAQKKPVVTYMHNIAASGGYVVSLASDHIVARGNTITGSIGVIMQVPNVSKLMENVGVSMTTIRSSDLKGEPTPFTKLSEKAETNLNNIIQDSQNWFLNLVKTRRPKMSNDHFKIATNGGVFSGRQAASLGLIDSVGSEKTALEWLQKKHKLSQEITIQDVDKPKELVEEIFGEGASSLLSHFLGFSIKKSLKVPLMIDGLLCLWQG